MSGRKLTIYLARGMDARSHADIIAEERHYLDLISSIGACISNPFDNTEKVPLRDAFDVTRNDLKTLSQSDILLADLPPPDYQYVGCIFEIVRAVQELIPVVLTIGESNLHKRLFFQSYCDFIARKPEDAVQFIYRAYSERGIALQQREMQSYFDSIADEYGEVSTHRRLKEDMPAYENERAILRGRIKKYAKGKACQIGIGTGDWTRTACECAMSVVAVDQSKQMIRRARVNLAQHKNIAFVLSDFLEDDLMETQFDSVIVFFLFSILPPSLQTKLLSRVKFILRPGGVILVADTKKLGDLPSIGVSNRRLQSRTAGDRTYLLYKEHFVGDSLPGMLKKNGFDIIAASRGSLWFSWVAAHYLERGHDA